MDDIDLGQQTCVIVILLTVVRLLQMLFVCLKGRYLLLILRSRSGSHPMTNGAGGSLLICSVYAKSYWCIYGNVEIMLYRQ